MNTSAKRALMILGGLCWLVFAAIIPWLLFQYLQDGAGLSGFVGMSSPSVLIGVIHFTGLIVASVGCFAVGTCLCAHGLVPLAPSGLEATRPQSVDCVVSDVKQNASAKPETVFLCVCCRVALHSYVQICPECGWTQPYSSASSKRQEIVECRSSGASVS